MTAAPDEARARAAVAALLKDIRDRKLLKWFFPTRGEYDPEVYIGHPDIKPIEPGVQQEIRKAWAAILLAALREARDEGAREMREAAAELCERCDLNSNEFNAGEIRALPLDGVDHDE